MKKGLTKIIVAIVAVICVAAISFGVSFYAPENMNLAYRLVFNENAYKAATSDVIPIVTIKANEFSIDTKSGANFLTADKSNGYGSEVAFLKAGSSVSFDVTVKKGNYHFSLDYYLPQKSMIQTTLSMKINGELPFYESRFLKLPSLWKDATQNYEKDKYGNDIVPKSERVFQWRNIELNDSSYSLSKPLQFSLKEGKNTVTITSQTTDVLLGNIHVFTGSKKPVYSEYIKNYSSKETYKGNPLTIQGEYYLEKSDSYIRPDAIMNASTVPYDSIEKRLNILSAASWKDPSQSVTWEVNVEKDGLYSLAFKYLQNAKSDLPVFKRIEINGEVPFAELLNYPFQYTDNAYKNQVIRNDNGELMIYLKKGKNNVTLTSTADMYYPCVSKIKEVIEYINNIAVEIKKITGNKTDKFRDWDIVEYIPTIADDLKTYIGLLEKEYNSLSVISGKKDPVVLNNLKLALTKLKMFADEPDTLPNNLDGFSQGSGSISQLLANQILSLVEQPVAIDYLCVGGENPNLSNANVGALENFFEETKRLFLSFLPKNDMAGQNEKEKLNVWVNLPVQYVDIIQQMIDRSYDESDLKVNLSIMPDEQKLILANASGRSPDVAIGISSWLPYEMALRGISLDLTKFDDFSEFAKKFQPASFTPYMIGSSCYAVPQTQDFNVLFYRKDIFEKLKLKVPNTWEDVINILPELERYGMGFSTQIANAGGFKPFSATSPYIFQNGGEIFAQNGVSTALGSEKAVAGFKLMTDLFTRYSLPENVANFYNSFRYGVTPIGIGNFGVYLQLSYAAPEITDQWAIAPSIGVAGTDGQVSRWQSAQGTSATIFKSTQYSEQAWKFLKWWLSSETQMEFAYNLQSRYGSTYTWNSANIDAFKASPLPENDKKVILEQWKWIKEVPRNPAYYMAERGLSDAWNRVVFDGENPRVSIDKAITDINREIKRKMVEFGYMDKDGTIIKPYPLPDMKKLLEGGE